MQPTVAAPLEAWASFYVIVGSSAGALTGLQFVVMTLIAQTGPRSGRSEAISAFGTPNVVHFCAALLVSALVTVPWGSLRHAGVPVAVCGLLGVIYASIVVRRAHQQSEYRPVFEDWLWHNALPLLAYSVLFVSGAILGRSPTDALFGIGAAALFLVFIGIHNAWDTVTYLITLQGRVEADATASTVVEARAVDSADSARGAATAPSAAAGDDVKPRATQVTDSGAAPRR